MRFLWQLNFVTIIIQWQLKNAMHVNMSGVPYVPKEMLTNAPIAEQKDIKFI